MLRSIFILLTGLLAVFAQQWISATGYSTPTCNDATTTLYYQSGVCAPDATFQNTTTWSSCENSGVNVNICSESIDCSSNCQVTVNPIEECIGDIQMYFECITELPTVDNGSTFITSTHSAGNWAVDSFAASDCSSTNLYVRQVWAADSCVTTFNGDDEMYSKTHCKKGVPYRSSCKDSECANCGDFKAVGTSCNINPNTHLFEQIACPSS